MSCVALTSLTIIRQGMPACLNKSERERESSTPASQCQCGCIRPAVSQLYTVLRLPQVLRRLCQYAAHIPHYCTTPECKNPTIAGILPCCVCCVCSHGTACSYLPLANLSMTPGRPAPGPRSSVVRNVVENVKMGRKAHVRPGKMARFVRLICRRFGGLVQSMLSGYA